MCTPESVITGSLSSPTFREKEASSKGFCIWPEEKKPKSPPLWAEEQSLNFDAKSSNFSSPFTIFSLYSKLMVYIELFLAQYLIYYLLKYPMLLLYFG